jgi:hypothetical protein
LGAVFVEGDVADPVQAVFHGIVASTLLVSECIALAV